MIAPLEWYSMFTGQSWSETMALPGMEIQLAILMMGCSAGRVGRLGMVSFAKDGEGGV